jgi:hypothetical protein
MTLTFQEFVMVLWFAVEYILRLWSAGCRFRYQDLSGRLHFARKPLCLVGKDMERTAVLLWICMLSESCSCHVVSWLVQLHLCHIVCAVSVVGWRRI